MRWVRYRSPAAEPSATPRVGVVVGDRIHGADPRVRMLDLIGAGTLREQGEAVLDRPTELVALAEVRLVAPIETPPTIRDFMAFERHVEGMGALVGAPQVPDVWYRQPLFYFSNPTSLIGPHDDVPVPPGSGLLDFELEVAAVIGTSVSNAALADLTVTEAAACIAGYALLNDWTARDLQAAEMEGPLGPCKGKDTAISLGPWLLTADELPGLATGEDTGIDLVAAIDGVVFGADVLDNMAWTFAEMIAYASRGTTLRPGDVIGSGTCANGCIAERWGRSGRDSFPSLQRGTTVVLDAGPLGSQSGRILPGHPVREPLTDRRRSTRSGGRLLPGPPSTTRP